MFRLLVLLCACNIVFGALPKGWIACKKADPKYLECLAREIENAVKSLTDGDKSLNVPPLDPLRITKLQLSKGIGPVILNVVISDADGYGLKNLQVKSIKNDWKTASIKVYLDKFVLLSKYKINGKIMFLPIVGEGNANITCEQMTVDAEIKWKRIKNGNTEYFHMESLTVPLDPKRVIIKLENLFNGDKALAATMNRFMNDNWELLFDEIEEPVSEALSIIFRQIANQILSKIPASEIDV